LLWSSFLQIFERLQLISSQLVVYQFSTELADGLDSRSIAPFWMEGIHGLAYERILGLTSAPNLGVGLANLIDPVQVDVSWNTNPGYASWFFLMPLYFPLYIVYTLGQIYFAVFLVRRMSPAVSALDMLWFACLLYMIPGWLASFVLFVHSLVLFYLFHVFVRFFSNIRSFESGDGRSELI
jgi:hypothetical protein